MRALVLGATGFIGGQIVRAAYAAGIEVHGLRRRTGAVGAVGDVPVIWREGDINQPDTLYEAMQGMDVLFHAAAYYPETERNVRYAMQRGVHEMRTVLETARRAGVGRVIYTSTLSTIGPPPPGAGRLADERDAYLPGSTWNAYYEAKWAMELEAVRAARDGLAVVILCPTAVFGSGDVKPTTGKLLLMLAKGRMPLAVDAVINMVDGRDVALAHVRAATLGTSGERYIIGGHNLNIAEALREAARIVGVRPPTLTLSMRTASRLLRLAEVLHLPLNATMRALPYWQPLNPLKGWQTFDLVPRPFEETVRDTVAWFREHRYL